MKGFIKHIIFAGIMLISFGNVCDAKSTPLSTNIPSELNDTLTVQSITISGNQKTKKRIIYNELLFKKNGKIVKADFYEVVSKSRNNLLNTSLFNFVYINYQFVDNENIRFDIKVDERWYTWLLPLLEHADRNFSSFLESGDWSRMNYGIYLKQENFRGMNETLKLKLRVGYLNEVELLFNSAEKNNKITWGTNFNYVALNQVSYGITNNEAIYIKTSSSFIEQRLGSEIYLRYRHNFVNRHKLTLQYNAFNINDTLATLNPNYLLNGNSNLQYFSLQYKYNRDLRDSKTYPLKGHMFEGSISRDGLGFIDNHISNFSLKFFFQQYGKITKRFYYGTNLGIITNSNNKNPFVISNGLGYKEFLNGYEYNVIESDNYGYLKSKILFELVPTKTANINFINLNQFSKLHYAIYLKPFIDVGYVHKENPNISNTLSNSYLYSYGIGLDLVTYYDKVLSVNYAINKFGYKGFYVHINLAM